MNTVRIGAVEYLNARPLVFRLEQDPRFDVRFDWPATCATLLHDGAIDVGIIPSIEYLRGPADATGAQAYHIVPNVSVSSRGPVASVAIFTTRPIHDVKSIALDTSSRTSVALTRVLSSRVFGIAPEFRPLGPDLPSMLAGNDAALLIGDRALLAPTGETEIAGRRVSVEKIDLGQAWLQATGLPFVFALWVGRGGALTSADVARLQQARDEGRAHLDVVSAEFFASQPELVSLGTRYLRDNIQHHLGEDECAGLSLFYRYAVETGVVPATQPLRFY